MPLHPDELPADEGVVLSLLREQRPDLADLPVTLGGGGTDNTVWRLGTDLVVRLPRTAEKVAPLVKELTWLPRLAAHLSHPVPALVHTGRATAAFPLPWAVMTWLEGEAPSSEGVTDWAGYGQDLARFVTSLHTADHAGASPDDGLTWYRGGPLHPLRQQVEADLVGARSLLPDLDWALLGRRWQEAVDLPGPRGPVQWLHGDLRPANLLLSCGRLGAVLDFGSLSLGHPDVEHVVAWDLPVDGRRAYRAGLGVEDDTWCRARGWAIALSVGGVCAYWSKLPSLAAESAARLRAVMADDD